MNPSPLHAIVLVCRVVVRSLLCGQLEINPSVDGDYSDLDCGASSLLSSG